MKGTQFTLRVNREIHFWDLQDTRVGIFSGYIFNATSVFKEVPELKPLLSIWDSLLSPLRIVPFQGSVTEEISVHEYEGLGRIFCKDGAGMPVTILIVRKIV